MVFGKLFKTVVSRATGAQAATGTGLVAAESATDLKAAMSKAMNLAGLGEKEWKCHCGHVFRAAGEWYPTEPAYCEAPACPNPTFYLDGPGRAMLESGKMGASTSDSKSVGGRFK